MENKKDFATRVALKTQAKQLIKSHGSYFILLYLISTLLMIVEVILSRNWDAYGYSPNWSLIAEFFGDTTLISATLVSIQALRNEDDFKSPIPKSFNVLTSFDKLSSYIMINLIKFVFIVGWLLLFIVPAFIKGLAYSQAYYIYQDHLDKGQPISYFDAISESRVLMKGHKADYFVLILSFIGWEFLNMLTLGIAGIWINPYIQTTFAAFYVDLVKVEAPNLKSATVVEH